MAVMDGVKVTPGAKVWFGGWGTVVSAHNGFFVAEFGGQSYTVHNDGTSEQSRRPGRVVYWAAPLEPLPESLKLNAQLKEAHALSLKHLRQHVRTYQRAGA